MIEHEASVAGVSHSSSPHPTGASMVAAALPYARARIASSPARASGVRV